MGTRCLRALPAVFALLCIVLLLPACGRNTDGQLPAASGKAIEVQVAAIEGFALASAYPDQHDGQLAIALEFSQPLVGAQDFDELIAVASDKGATVSGSWVLDDGGKVLRFPHVEAGKDYKITIKAGLTAADGDRLGQEIERTVSTGPLDPVVGFASQGSVLPARESRGLPVVSVNVDEVDVEFLRVHEKSLPQFFSEYQRGGRRSGWSLDADYGSNTPLGKLAESVYANRFVLGGKPNERVLTHLPLQEIKELQEPGLYFAVMRRVGRFSDQYETAFFTVSDLGLHARAYKDKLFVHVASLANGAPVGSVDLRILNGRGEPVFKGETDRHGNAMLDYKMVADHVLIAGRGGDVSMLPFNQPALDLSEFAVAGRVQAWFDVFAWSGRDLYRPGETVRVSALLRDQDGKPLADADKARQPLYVRYVQPDGKTLIETALEPDAQGYVRHEQIIPSDAATGRWKIEFRSDPASKEAVQGMTLRIEEFLPERMKLDLDSPQKTLKPGEPFRLKATGAYLYGASAAGNRFTAKLAVAVEQHPLDGMPGWFFGDPTVSLPREAKEVVDTELGADGTFEKDIPLPAEAKPTTPIAAIVSGSLFETGGRSVNRNLKRVLWPAEALVGVRPLFDDKDGTDANAKAGFELTRVGADGQPRPGKDLRVTLVRERRTYFWSHDDERGWDYDFTRRFEDVQTREVALGESPQRIDFDVEWGEYRVDVFDPATQLTTRYPFTAGWSWSDDNRGLDARPDKVKLSLDKTGYRAGDTLRATLTPPHEGKGLVMVESDRMLFVKGIDVKAGTTIDIPVTEDWERHDVYVTALVFRGGSAPSKVTPARAVGVAHVPMDRKERKVAVGLVSPELMRPERDLPVTVSVPQLAGKDAWVTLSAVDVGILNITRFPVPDASAHFFAQRRLGVDAYDVYGRVIESFDGSVARLRFGGDMALQPLAQARRPTARVLTVDLFAGPVKLDGQGNARIKLPVPDFNGTLRVSALVFSGGHYGSHARETVVRAPVLAEASIPRVLAPGDRSQVTLDVQNFTGKPGTFRVQVDGIGPVAIGNGSRSVELKSEGKTTLDFPLTAREGYEVAQVRIRVDGNGYKVDRKHDLPVRAAWPSVLRASTRVLDELATVRLPPDLSAGLMMGSVNARLSVSALPPIPFASALEGALKYPYGCAEQTTSKGYAALELDEGTARMLGIQGLDATTRRNRMEGAFARLAGMQISSGHFSMWGSGDYVNPLITPYIVEFLLDARDAGFDVPDAMLQKALKVLGEDLLSGGPPFFGYDRRDHLKFAYQAYAGYALARVNRAPLGTLRALHDNNRDKSLTGLPLVHLGLALSLQGDKARGAKAIAEGFEKGSVPRRSFYLGDYGSSVRDEALMIALVHKHDLATPGNDARALDIGREIDARRRGGWLWLSTQEQVALARLGKALMADQSNRISGEWAVGDETSAVATTRFVSRDFNHEALLAGVGFTPEGKTPLYATFEVAGVPRAAPAPDESAIKVTRRWYTPDGKPWSGGALEEGDVLIAAVSVVADQAMPDALLTDLLPAGLEIENFNLADSKQLADVVIDGITLSDRERAAEVRHEEFRDDRYVAALKLDRARTARVFYMVRAVTPGTYTVPPPLVEDMYRPDLRGIGRAAPATVTVVPPGGGG
ncbi:alpha-2-macroglobulin family protein [Marilutibacter alkalisoli]|uniref:Alpha-2-macroglobulin n=1 Tax=Marilutibacter alkalisoli TaxID=2591633 RepID=A0A514BRA1_9GAMM|nr:alpha-2-macroglobulin [Lysobacter alkalisoli]QDH69910.1 alpha-2-macroglobulin family protein [Lysobacter alkalisoli]